jgi:hypothetical protein
MFVQYSSSRLGRGSSARPCCRAGQHRKLLKHNAQHQCRWYFAGVIQLVECQLPKLDVAGSSPVARSDQHQTGKHLLQRRKDAGAGVLSAFVEPTDDIRAPCESVR